MQPLASRQPKFFAGHAILALPFLIRSGFSV
jgi:hypothetical protein